MIHIPGGVPPQGRPQGPKKVGAPKENAPAQEEAAVRVPQRPPEGKGRMPMPAMDARAMAISEELRKLEREARGKELSFEEIIEKVIKETGLVNPQAAMEEADRALQKEIETALDQIKNNKNLMEEADAWQNLAELLESNLTDDQVRSLFDVLQSEVHGLK